MLDSRAVLPTLTLGAALALTGCDWFEKWLEEHGHHHAQGDAGPAAAEGGVSPAECAADQFLGGADGRTCIRRATSVSAGVYYSCAVLAGGSAKCWGGESWGRLGYGAPGEDLGDEPGELGDALPSIALGAGVTVSQISTSNDLTCALLGGGGVKCWGYNGYGATGSGMLLSGLAPDLLPERTFGAQSALAVAAGAGFGSALLDDGTISSWGDSGATIGAGRVAVSFERAPIYDHWHVCAVLDDDSVVCNGRGGSWHSGALGYMGTAATSTLPPPVDLGTGRSARAVSAGRDLSCALLDDATVKCWGNNFYGQLGQGDTLARGVDPSSMGDALAPIPLATDAVAVSAGLYHACAILIDGTVRCWGRNDEGQLGIGSTDDVGDAPGEVAALAPVDLGPGRTAVAIDAGSHTCVVLDNGGVKCWGRNASGELGQGDTTARGTTPGQLGAALLEIDLGG